MYLVLANTKVYHDPDVPGPEGDRYDRHSFVAISGICQYLLFFFESVFFCQETDKHTTASTFSSMASLAREMLSREPMSAISRWTSPGPDD